jgi:hypothetical protein
MNTKNVNETHARPMASEEVAVGKLNETGRRLWSNESNMEPPIRLELWARNATLDQPVRDEDSNECIVYPADIDGLRLAHAHLESLPAFDPELPYATVYFIKAVTVQDEDGISRRWTNRVRLEEKVMRDPATGLPLIDDATGEEIVKHWQNSAEKTALRNLGEIQKARRNASAKQRNWLQQGEAIMYQKKSASQ